MIPALRLPPVTFLTGCGLIGWLPMGGFLLPLQTFSQVPSLPIPTIRGVKIRVVML